MITRVLRTCIASAVIAALLLSPVPSHATGGGTMQVFGRLQLWPETQTYPCFANGAPDLSRCPPPLGSHGPTTPAFFSGTTLGGVTHDAAVELGIFTFLSSGSVTGVCGLSTGSVAGTMFATTPIVDTGVSGRDFSLRWSEVGGVAVAEGTTSLGEELRGVLYLTPSSAGGSSCFHQAWAFDVLGQLAFVDQPSPLPPLGGGSGPSNECGGITVHDGTTLGVRTFLRVESVNTQTAKVCVRVETGGSGYGGQFVVNGPTGLPGMPVPDEASHACTASPSPTGTIHPLASGQFGGPGDPVHVPYLLDWHVDANEVWVCVQAGDIRKRLILPLQPPSTGWLPSVNFHADPGTPDPI